MHQKRIVIVRSVLSVITTFIFVLILVVVLTGGCNAEKVNSGILIRFAQFNIWEMSTKKLTEVNSEGTGTDVY